MSHEPTERTGLVDAFADVVKQLPYSRSARQHEAGWHRVRRGLAEGGAPAEDAAGAFWSRPRWRLARAALLPVLGIAVLAMGPARGASPARVRGQR